jgi:hypothetical protein
MKAAVFRYMNEIVSITILALMSVALIAGQADATTHEMAVELQQDFGPALIRADFAIELNFAELAKLHVDRDSIDAIREILETRIERQD